MRVALYARVSTRDKDQNCENQLVLGREAEWAGATIIKEYINQEAEGKASRKQFRMLVRAADKRQFDLVRVFALDRFSSAVIAAVFEHTTRPEQGRAAFYCELMLNTTGPLAALCKAIIAWAAGYRKQRHSGNVRLGRARKRAQVETSEKQHQHGRRPTDETVVARVRKLAAQGLRRLAEATGVSVGTGQHYLAA